MSHPQLPLHLRWREHPGLTDFVPGSNGVALAAVHALTRADTAASPLLLRGDAATGKTHLLLAACQATPRDGAGAAYLPLAELRRSAATAAAIVEGLEHHELVCVDDLQAVAGEREWEEALFHLYNRCEAGGARLLLALRGSVPGLGLRMADLVSRLRHCVTFTLEAPDDHVRAEVLRRRARARGLSLPEDVVGYLLSRHARDLHSLLRLLERLDRAALAGKRRLTVPLAREVLEGPRAGTG